MRKSILALALAASFITPSAFAKRFTSQYCEFELPPGWECALEGTEWVCQAENKDRQKEAIIILAAKIRGEQDDLQQYSAYLGNTKTFTLPGGKTQVSEPKYAKLKDVNGHNWVDSLHLASEVPGFYTRYMATVKEDLGVAVTFSVGKDFYEQYRGIFDKIISTLRVFRQKQGSNDQYALANANAKPEDIIGGDILDNGLRGNVEVDRKGAAGGGGFLAENGGLLLIVLAIAGIGGVVMKMRKGGAKGAKKKKKTKKS